MSIFEYKNHSDPKESPDNSHPHSFKCIYCSERLLQIDVPDLWPVADNEVLAIHEDVKEGYKELHGLEDCYLNLQMDKADIEVVIQFCTTCGWWRLVKDICVYAEVWQIWDIFFGCVGSLKSFSLQDVNMPIEEVNDYLVAKYSDRFYVNPRIFEEVVAGVFKSIGYNVYVTGYTNDGGVDIILENPQNDFIGVQVKRYKDKIKAEQIRTLAGALLLNGYTKGIFVTTSEYQPGAVKAAQKFAASNLLIELIDSKKFFEALKISQRPQLDIDKVIKSVNKEIIPNIYSCGWDTPRNSL